MELGKHGIKAVADIREGHAPASEGHEGEIQHLVGAVGDEHVLRPHAVKPRQLFFQPLGGGVGVEPQQRHLLAVHGRRHGWSGGIGRFVGVQFDVLHIPGLLSGGVGLHSPVSLIQETAHRLPSFRMVTLLPCARRPSFSAKAAILSAAFARASGV